MFCVFPYILWWKSVAKKDFKKGKEAMEQKFKAVLAWYRINSSSLTSF